VRLCPYGQQSRVGRGHIVDVPVRDGTFRVELDRADVCALLAVAAAINRLADAVSEVGTPATYQPPERR
jgi:hypothetical protein